MPAGSLELSGTELFSQLDKPQDKERRGMVIILATAMLEV